MAKDKPMTNQNLDKQMEENIKNYANRIETIDSYVDAIRKTVGYHLGSVGNKGHLTMIREIYQNSGDEAVKEDSPCNHIWVEYDERTKCTTVEDNGRGIPFNNIERVFTTAYTSSNYTKKEGEFSSGVNGSGGKIVAALSSIFTIESYILGEARRLELYDGKPWDKGELKLPNTSKQGTKISFIPSYDVMGEITTSCKDVFNLISLIFPLLKIGTIIDFKGIDINGKVVIDEHMVNEDGIITNLILKTAAPLVKPIYIIDQNTKMKAEVAFTYDSQSITAMEDITSFSNYCPTPHAGTHVDGLMDGITRFFRDYMNKIYLNNSNKLNVIGNDIKSGLKAIIAVSHINPIFGSQAKENLTNQDMFYYTRDLVFKSLEQWSKDNPNDLQKLCKYFKEIAEIRTKSDDSKIKLSTKYQTSLLSGMPKKYIKPSGNKNLELFILEGDSALGSARGSRISATQGLFPIRGKIPNAFSTEKSKFLSNEEVASIITIIGGGYGKSFDIEKVKWEKIVFLADADADGAHINSLLLRFFLLYLPDLIKAGKVYRAVPPLFGVKIGKKMKYFTDKIDFTRYNQNIFSKDNIISTLTNVKLTNNECIDLFIRNVDYTYELETVSNTYAINQYLLENILYRFRTEEQRSNFAEFKKSIEGIYRFLKVRKENDGIIIEGLVDSKFHTIFLNDRLLKDCTNIINIINSNQLLVYKLNDQITNIYQLMKSYEAALPKDITRYKGLGEQDPMQLAESTLYLENRTLIRYTIEDIVQEIDTIRYIESNRQELLKNINIKRQDIE